MSKIRFYENLHILFWLIKDLSWVMFWRPLGMAMIIPTLGFAIWFCIKTFQEKEFYVYLATLFWITANALWMLLEFFQREEYKFISAILFVIGLVNVVYYVYLEIRCLRK
ncbi:MAG: hypothetical protein KatS3mg027_1550 [Bacteroidia bacterium]|nr:MAG: hypothetical protein KatS3mg027_1550 [Bacteroidia bacterium]